MRRIDHLEQIGPAHRVLAAVWRSAGCGGGKGDGQLQRFVGQATPSHGVKRVPDVARLLTRVWRVRSCGKPHRSVATRAMSVESTSDPEMDANKTGHICTFAVSLRHN